MSEKRCTKCETVKPVTEFHKRAASADGYRTACKACRIADSAEYRTSHRERIAAYERVRARTPQRLAAQRERSRRMRASVTQLCAAEEGCPNIARAPRCGALCAMHEKRLRAWGTTDESGRKDMRGPNNPNWAGVNVSYGGAHLRVRSERGRASTHLCVECNRPAVDWSYRGAAELELYEVRRFKGNDIPAPYSPDPYDYDPRCKSCHTSYDMKRERAKNA